MTDESARLLTFQQQLEHETDGKVAFFGLNLNETIKTCILNGLAKRADKIKSDFKVPDKRSVQPGPLPLMSAERCGVTHRFWYLKLYALTAARDFEGLDAFAKAKRSPIGYEPFVHHLVEAGHATEAVAYVARCDSPKRAELYVACGEWRLAGKECKDRNDKAKLEYVRH